MGPNNATGSGVDNAEPGDPYLTTVAGTQTYNAAILEFDFTPVGDTVKFNYVFGTEEYMEWITGGFADVFAFVLSGVTTVLPAVNIATLPITGQPVTALNVNANINSQYYVDNETVPGQTLQYDGFTVVLTAQHPVICGETYHIKIMIADAIDGAVDAGVFLEAGSFNSNGSFSADTAEISMTTIGSIFINNELFDSTGIYYQILQSQSGCDSILMINLIVIPLEVDEFVIENLEIFPNPTTDIIHINIPDNLIFDKIMITDLCGNILIRENVILNFIDISNLKSGSYFILIDSGDKFFFKPFIKY